MSSCASKNDRVKSLPSDHEFERALVADLQAPRVLQLRSGTVSFNCVLQLCDDRRSRADLMVEIGCRKFASAMSGSAICPRVRGFEGGSDELRDSGRDSWFKLTVKRLETTGHLSVWQDPASPPFGPNAKTPYIGAFYERRVLWHGDCLSTGIEPTFTVPSYLADTLAEFTLAELRRRCGKTDEL